MTATLDLVAAVGLLRAGGVIAYPTEGVWGLGCDPFDQAAVHRVLAIKQCPAEKGMILIAGDLAQLDGIVDWPGLSAERTAAVRATWPGAHTWVAPSLPQVPRWITGAHDSVAVRVSAHSAVIALCAAFGGPLVSTSANLTGLPAVRTLEALDPALLARLDGVLDGQTGDLDRATPIRDARSGESLRS